MNQKKKPVDRGNDSTGESCFTSQPELPNFDIRSSGVNLDQIPEDKRPYCNSCLKRWKKHGDQIIECVDQARRELPFEAKKVIGSDTLIRFARNIANKTYPGGNDFAPFDLWASSLVLGFPISNRDPQCRFLFEAGWVPEQAQKKGDHGND